MKKLALTLSALFALLFSVHALAGVIPGNSGNPDPGVTTPNPVAQPNSKAFGKSLDSWMEAYFRWWEDGADPAARVGNVGFLDIFGESPYTVQVTPGTSLVLPLAAWLGEFEGDTLPDDWWGDPAHIFADVVLDGQPIAVPNADYYVGPTAFDPPLFGGAYISYQGIIVVIKPLTPGLHQIDLHAEFVDFGVAFDNTWYITVVP